MPFRSPKISAYDALVEAQKIAFAPVIFQVARSLRALSWSGWMLLSDLAARRSTEYTGNVPILLELSAHQSVDVTPPALTAVPNLRL